MLATDLPGAVWRKSSRSANNCACVEVTLLGDGTIGVRDSKDPAGPALGFTPAEWDAFIGGVRDGEFDRDRLADNTRAGWPTTPGPPPPRVPRKRRPGRWQPDTGKCPPARATMPGPADPAATPRERCSCPARG
ncbi:DUF397 domain-containing protein [Microbispora cellulosiformans]|uniref:DUF397 domain-containing protein n=1 Tax=Microbispora cellulosiformans TaxID=2614688 RepID=A0A5J5K4W3_9ACTN|nr:DUF397 domain-containing protein [Microbispora cellulosiformans]KAA9379635.1 DUF397 domain-containing protein [Microbispora cellulosiformans]